MLRNERCVCTKSATKTERLETKGAAIKAIIEEHQREIVQWVVEEQFRDLRIVRNKKLQQDQWPEMDVGRRCT